jgi:hypothetical protein
MDIFSHALWGSGLFGFRRYFWLALFFGAFPDLSSFGIFFILRLINGTYTYGKPPLSSIPNWLFFNYNVTHSFVIAFSTIGLVSLWKKEVAFAMLGWPFHICLDFPFHSASYFPSPLFWPISDFVVDGIPWKHRLIWYPNIAGVILLYLWRLKHCFNR